MLIDVSRFNTATQQNVCNNREAICDMVFMKYLLVDIVVNIGSCLSTKATLSVSSGELTHTGLKVN